MSDDLTAAEIVDRYAAAARVIALYLGEFCDESLPYDEMIADAARKAAAALTAERQAREQAEAVHGENAQRVLNRLDRTRQALEQAEQERDRLREHVEALEAEYGMRP
jgi:hypothetical protein